MVLIIDHSSQFHFMALALLLALPSHLEPQQKERRYDEEQNIEEGIIVKITRWDGCHIKQQILGKTIIFSLLVSLVCMEAGRAICMMEGLLSWILENETHISLRKQTEAHFFTETQDENKNKQKC